MPGKKIPRKKLLKEPDEFISTTGKILRFLRGHRRQVILYGVIGLVILLAGAAGYYFLLWQESKAQVIQHQAKQIYAEALFAASSPEKQKEKYKNALEKFRESLSFYTRNRVSQIAHLYMGHCHYALKEYPQAISAYTRCLSGPYRAIARDGIAHSFEAQGDFAQALEHFQKNMEEERNPYLLEAILGVARCYETLKQTPKAVEFYEKALARKPPERIADLIHRKIIELKG